MTSGHRNGQKPLPPTITVREHRNIKSADRTQSKQTRSGTQVKNADHLIADRFLHGLCTALPEGHGLEALRGVKTINEIGQEHGVHPVQVGQWKKAIQEQAKTLFEGKRGPKPVAAHREPELLYSEIGKLKVELDWLKKKSGISLS